MLEASVVVCTHNPREAPLTKVLAALREQTLPLERWELVVVDNASSPPLEGRVDLGWHPNARLVVEPTLGLTVARLRGARESRADVLVYVDDDNVLAPDYLAHSVELAATHPKLGSWGGNIELHFEEPPPAWSEPYWDMLTRKTVLEDCINQDVSDFRLTPYGAGLCVRHAVVDAYARQLEQTPWRRRLDRQGQSLMSAGDLDLATTACDIGLDKGVFARLHVTHLIPPSRLREDYLLRLNTAMEFSNWVMWWCREPDRVLKPWNFKRWRRHFRRLRKLEPRERRFYRARMRGQRQALRMRRLLERRQTDIDPARMLRDPGRPSD